MMNIKTTPTLHDQAIIEYGKQTEQFSIYNISEIDLLDLVIDARGAGLKLPTSLTSMINWALYRDMHLDDGGPFYMLSADDEFLDCLAWHDTLDD